MTNLTGRCPCGTIQYSLSDRPLFVHACHCRCCQRESGAAFAMNGIIEASAVEVTGTPVWVEVPTESGKGQQFARCPDCQVALWSIYSGAGEKFWFLRLGTLDNPDACPPDIHIFTESKQPWVILPDDVPVMERYYRRSQHWPDWAMARRQAVLDSA